MTNSRQKPYVWNFELVHGDSWPAYSFTITDSESNPRDLSSAVVLMQVKHEGKTPVIKEVTNTAGGFIITGDDNNKAVFNTAVDMPVGCYTYDVQITYVSGEVKTYFEGNINVKQDVSWTI